MKISLENFRKAWFFLMDESQGPTELPSKPCKSQVVNEDTKLRYERISAKTKTEKTDGPVGNGER